MESLSPPLQHIILDATSSSALWVEEVIQELWSGYGQILRVRLEGGDLHRAIVKHVRFGEVKGHPRGWHTDLSHQRKVRSYEVEGAWYRDWSDRCDDSCRVPRVFACEDHGDEVVLVLEDLDAAGYRGRRSRPSWPEFEHCLSWLASFHATFMTEEPKGLWEVGTYWHLDTRPDELDALDDAALKMAAPSLDARLRRARFQTFVHGDAKLANFCFADDGESVAAVDFQYVGGGCGMKDVAYFVGSCFDERACEAREGQVLDTYFAALRAALRFRRPMMDAEAVIDEWRELYPVAWTDFHRFLKGWSPGHWKLNSYSERVARGVLDALETPGEGRPA